MEHSERESKQLLSALTPETLAERQRIVDAAVRAARNNSYCETFNEMISRVMPEMVIWVNGYPYAFDTDGRDCRGYSIEDRVQEDRDTYGDDGYGVNSGRDRDGFDRWGYDADGYDAQGFGRAYSRDRLYWKYEHGEDAEGRSTTTYARCDVTDPDRYDRERMYNTGYGTSTYLDKDGNKRPARPATPEEEATERADTPEPFNPTTWKPADVLVTVG